MSLTSRPVYTSTAEGFRDTKEIDSLRPMAEPKPRAARKAVNPALRQVTSGIVCFCGERFGESRALEFMLHLRAEVGEELAILDRHRKAVREYHVERLAADPEWRERRNAQKRERQRQQRQDPEYRDRLNARRREQARERRANDPEYRERRNAQGREQSRKRWADNPEWRERNLAYQRAWRERKKREANA